METRALLAFVISVAILVGYQYLFAPAPVPVPVPGGEPGTSGEARPAAPSPTVAPGVPEVAPATPEQDRAEEIPARSGEDERVVAVETELYRAVFTSFGGRLKHFELENHRLTPDPDSPPLDMVVADSRLPLGVYWTRADGSVADDGPIDFEIRTDASEAHGDADATITLVGVASDGTRVTKTVVLHGDSYVLDYSVQVEAAHAPPVGVAWARAVSEDAGRLGGIDGPAAYVEAALHASAASSLEDPLEIVGLTDWAGYADHYFLSAYFPSEPRVLRFVGRSDEGVGQAILWDDQAAGRVSYKLFVGPKKLNLLQSLGHSLSQAVDLGWFAFVARPLLELLVFLHRFTGNYGWAIILITVGIRIVFYPVNKRQIESMKAMQRVQPELKRIQEKFKDDRERLNKEMMEVYRRHKVNPLSGCLPMLLQLPVFLGLYNALLQSIELRHAPFLGWIHDLSQPDRLGSLPIPFVSPPGIPVMTLLMGASMVIQQRMTPGTGDPVQQRMMMFLPVIFTVMFINFPAGLVLYWLSNNVLSIVQQQLTTRRKS